MEQSQKPKTLMDMIEALKSTNENFAKYIATHKKNTPSKKIVNKIHKKDNEGNTPKSLAEIIREQNEENAKRKAEMLSQQKERALKRHRNRLKHKDVAISDNANEEAPKN